MSKEWWEEATGMTLEEIHAEMDKPREEWSRQVVQLVVAVLLADMEVDLFICKKEDMEIT